MDAARAVTWTEPAPTPSGVDSLHACDYVRMLEAIPVSADELAPRPPADPTGRAEEIRLMEGFAKAVRQMQIRIPGSPYAADWAPHSPAKPERQSPGRANLLARRKRERQNRRRGRQ